jgi:hypothetical protein
MWVYETTGKLAPTDGGENVLFRNGTTIEMGDKTIISALQSAILSPKMQSCRLSTKVF